MEHRLNGEALPRIPLQYRSNLYVIPCPAPTSFVTFIVKMCSNGSKGQSFVAEGLHDRMQIRVGVVGVPPCDLTSGLSSAPAGLNG